MEATCVAREVRVAHAFNFAGITNTLGAPRSHFYEGRESERLLQSDVTVILRRAATDRARTNQTGRPKAARFKLRANSQELRAVF